MIWNMERFKFAALLLLWFPAHAAVAENPDSLFAAGNQRYESGAYQEAVDHYDALVAGGYQNAAVYYNLGNAHYKLHNLASAILYYEKALKLDPTDPDIQANLNFVNLAITDRIQPLPEFFIESWWRGFVFSRSLTTWSVIGLCCWLLAFALLAVYLYAFRPKVKRAAFYGGTAMMTAAFCLLLVAYSQHRIRQDHQGAVVFRGKVPVKSAPAENEKTLFVIHEGTKVRIAEQVNDWIKVILPNGNEGWIEFQSVETI